MADEKKVNPELTKGTMTLRHLGNDRVAVEFVIEDLIKELIELDRFSPIAACNGCNSCSADVSLRTKTGNR